MSQEMQTDDSIGDPDEFRTTVGVSTTDLDLGGDDHTLADVDHERQFDASVIGGQLADLYDDRSAFVRESLSNAEMATYVRAIEMLSDEGYDREELVSPEWSFTEVMEAASEELGYDPVIEVTRSRNPDDHAFVIDDQGIGISRDKYRALRDAGYSGWHGVSGGSGMMGLGTWSLFLASGKQGRFGMITRSAKTEQSFAIEWRLDRNRPLPFERELYGTTFFVPSFSPECREEVDVRKAVEEYSEALRVTVKYEEYDEDGKLVFDDEYGPTHLEERFDDGSLVVSYQDEFVKAVYSPDISRPRTFNVSHTTKRNDGKYSTMNYSYEMPGEFDVRVLREADRGFIYECESQPELVGKRVVTQGEIEQMDEDEREDYVTVRAVPDDAIFTPSVTSDRDRFENNERVQDFMKRVSQHLRDELHAAATDLFQSFDSFEDMIGLDGAESELLDVATQEFLTIYKKNDVERLQEQIEEKFDTTLDERTVTRFNAMSEKVSLAPRDKNASKISKKRGRTRTSALDVLQMAGEEGNVYMQQTLTSERKVALAWELHEDNQVVAVDTSKYDEFKEKYGWKLLKELPTSGFVDEFPNHDFDEDFLDKYDRSVGATKSSSSSSTGPDLSDMDFDEERAKQRRIKVRIETGMGSFRRGSGEHVYDTFDGDEGSTLGAEHLIVYDGNEHGASVGAELAKHDDSNVAYAVVPEYVRSYLLQADRVFTEESYEQWLLDCEIEFMDGSTSTIEALDERDAVLFQEFPEEYDEWSDIQTAFDDHDVTNDEIMEALAGLAGVDAIDRVAIVDPTRYYHAFRNRVGLVADEVDATCIRTTNYGFDNYSDAHVDLEELFFETIMPDVDRTSIEWKKIRPSPSDTELLETLQTVASENGFPSNRDDVELPDVPSELDNHGVRKYVDESHLYMTKLVESANEIGGDDDE